MKDERELAIKKKKRAEKGKATIFGWDMTVMSKEAKVVYPIAVIVILAAAFYYLYKKVTKQTTSPKKKDKSPKKAQ